MAKAFDPPVGYEFSYKNYIHDNWKEIEDEYINRLKKFCKSNPNSKSPLLGEIIRFPVADGHAIYMVAETSPLSLIHVPIGDAWQANPCLISGIRLKDVKEKIQRQKRIKKLIDKKQIV